MSEQDVPPGATDRNLVEAVVSAFTAKTRRDAEIEHQEREHARRRLAERYGSDLEKRWAADDDGPLVDPVSLLRAFLNKAARPAPFRTPEMEQAPDLEREDALAAAHMIRAARADARRRDNTAMRHILAHGVTWDELAQILETSPEEVRETLRQEGAQPDTWTESSAEGAP